MSYLVYNLSSPAYVTTHILFRTCQLPGIAERLLLLGNISRGTNFPCTISQE